MRCYIALLIIIKSQVTEAIVVASCYQTQYNITDAMTSMTAGKY